MFTLTESEIMAHWLDNNPVRVSICCITYNQEQYIAQAIDSFLMQKTTFPFEIIIGEDCGSDGTLAILAEYQTRYPNLIKVITAENNVGANANLLRVFNAAQGDYISVCEGDDYWCDEYKLEEHFKYLESNDNCVLHMYDCFEERDGVVQPNSSKLKRMGIVPGLYSPDKIRNGLCMMLMTSCFKNTKKHDYPSYFSKSINFDTLLTLALSNYGFAYVDGSKKVAVYRLQDNGIWSNKSETYKFYESMHTLLVQSRYLETELKCSKYADKIIHIVISGIRKIGFFNFIISSFGIVVRKLMRKLTLLK
ncbi:glycosyltransferase family 2 protein [Aeromonas caviae]|uniref:glycosyltransferase family 2 protein n=1 Tax=Aeromonas caviae TaxID=648 RepID=UPI0038D1CEEF